MENEKNKVGRPLKYKTVEELEKAIDNYFEECRPKIIKDCEDNIVTDKNGNPVYELHPSTITGLCLYLGFNSRQSIYNYQDRPEFLDTIKKAILRCENFVEEGLFKGILNPAAGIFALKNYGWKDNHEIEHIDKTDRTELLKELARLRKKHLESDNI